MIEEQEIRISINLPLQDHLDRLLVQGGLLVQDSPLRATLATGIAKKEWTPASQVEKENPTGSHHPGTTNEKEDYLTRDMDAKGLRRLLI